MNPKVTTPLEMKLDHAQLNEAIEMFEAELLSQSKGRKTYYLRIFKTLDYSVLNEIEEIYEHNGWCSVVCHSDDDSTLLTLNVT